MRTHWKWLTALLCVLALLALSGCAESKAAKDEVVLRVWFSSFESENAELREIAAEFREKTGVRVEVYSSNFFDILSRFPNAAETEERPDIVFMQSTDTGALIESGYLEPIDFLAQDTRERYDEVAFDAFTYRDVTYGMGYSVDAYGLLYNRDLISEPPDTWDEFYALAEQLTVRSENGEVQQWGALFNATNMWFTYPLLKNYGGYYLGTDAAGAYNPDDVGLNSPGMIAGVEKLLELQEGGLVLESGNQSDSHIVKRFAEGRVAMTFYGLWNASLFQDSGIDYALASLPLDPDTGRRSQPLSAVQGFVLNHYSLYPEEARAFYQYIYEDENQQRLYEAANGHEQQSGVRNTCNRSVAASDYMQSSEILRAQYALGRESEVFPNNPEGPLLWNYAQSVMRTIFYPESGQMPDVAAKMDAFQQRVEADIIDMRAQLDAGSSDVWILYGLAGALLAAVLAAWLIWRHRRKTNPRPGIIRPRDTLPAWLIMMPFLGMMALFYLYPILDNIHLSLTDYSNLRLKDYAFVGLANYRTILSDAAVTLLPMLLWTLLFAALVVSLSFLLGTVLAVLLEQTGVRLSRFLRVLFILPWAVPSVITLLMWQGLLDTSDGLINALLGIIGLGPVPWLTDPFWARFSAIGVMTWFSFPYYMTVSQGIIGSIPRDYYESVHIDGGTNRTCFFRITLPTVLRAIMPALLMGFLMQFNQFGVYMLTGGGPPGKELGAPGATDLLITYVFQTAFRTNRYGLAAAYSVILFLLIGLFSFFAMRTINRQKEVS